jgi:hypothetical protein
MTKRLLIVPVLLLVLVGSPLLLLAPPSVPQAAIQTSVNRVPDLMDAAWRLPVAASFDRQVSWQSNRSLCGPASLANIFRSLGEPATTEATVLQGTGKCWTGFCIMGLTLDELAEVARAHTHRSVAVLRDLTPDRFREEMRHANDPDRRYVVNFNRSAIFGAGGGHHSPIGGYLEKEDMVLVLDVNQDFQPWLIERSKLFAAVDTLDGNRKRGLLLIK